MNNKYPYTCVDCGTTSSTCNGFVLFIDEYRSNIELTRCYDCATITCGGFPVPRNKDEKYCCLASTSNKYTSYANVYFPHEVTCCYSFEHLSKVALFVSKVALFAGSNDKTERWLSTFYFCKKHWQDLFS